jgi:hypothetical protein
MFKKATSLVLIPSLLAIVAAIPIIGLSACDAGNADGSSGTPEIAESEALLEGVRADADCDYVQDWVTQNAGHLPTKYADIVRYPMTYRRAMLATLDPQAKSRLWGEHLQWYQKTHPNLATGQAEVIDRAAEILSDATIFEQPRSANADQQIKDLGEAAIAAFGQTEAAALIATLGPTENARAISGDCECNADHDWCIFGDCHPSTRSHLCFWSGTGCGVFQIHQCNGLCR